MHYSLLPVKYTSNTIYEYAIYLNSSFLKRFNLKLDNERLPYGPF